MMVQINQLKMHIDNRGFVCEPIEKESLLNQKNCHLVVSGPGVVRGNHYHLNGTEIIAVVGPAFLRFKDQSDIYDFEIPENDVYKFTIPPMISHAVKNTSDKNNILVAFNTLEHDPNNPDLRADILIDD